jgi:hypothetical protein
MPKTYVDDIVESVRQQRWTAEPDAVFTSLRDNLEIDGSVYQIGEAVPMPDRAIAMRLVRAGVLKLEPLA